jgi:hypothetical protein
MEHPQLLNVEIWYSTVIIRCESKEPQARGRGVNIHCVGWTKDGGGNSLSGAVAQHERYLRQEVITPIRVGPGDHSHYWLTWCEGDCLLERGARWGVGTWTYRDAIYAGSTDESVHDQAVQVWTGWVLVDRYACHWSAIAHKTVEVISKRVLPVCGITRRAWKDRLSMYLLYKKDDSDCCSKCVFHREDCLHCHEFLLFLLTKFLKAI